MFSACLFQKEVLEWVILWAQPCDSQKKCDWKVGEYLLGGRFCLELDLFSRSDCWVDIMQGFGGGLISRTMLK